MSNVFPKPNSNILNLTLILTLKFKIGGAREDFFFFTTARMCPLFSQNLIQILNLTLILTLKFKIGGARADLFSFFTTARMCPLFSPKGNHFKHQARPCRPIFNRGSLQAMFAHNCEVGSTARSSGVSALVCQCTQTDRRYSAGSDGHWLF